jgi:hypothetical protein
MCCLACIDGHRDKLPAHAAPMVRSPILLRYEPAFVTMAFAAVT